MRKYPTTIKYGSAPGGQNFNCANKVDLLLEFQSFIKKIISISTINLSWYIDIASLYDSEYSSFLAFLRTLIFKTEQ